MCVHILTTPCYVDQQHNIHTSLGLQSFITTETAQHPLSVPSPFLVPHYFRSYFVPETKVPNGISIKMLNMFAHSSVNMHSCIKPKLMRVLTCPTHSCHNTLIVSLNQASHLTCILTSIHKAFIGYTPYSRPIGPNESIKHNTRIAQKHIHLLHTLPRLIITIRPDDSLYVPFTNALPHSSGNGPGYWCRTVLLTTASPQSYSSDVNIGNILIISRTHINMIHQYLYNSCLLYTTGHSQHK